MCKNFERMLAFHCAPTFVGIKPANLVSWSEEAGKPIALLLEKYNDVLSRNGIVLEQFSRNETRALVLVYREDLLPDNLHEPRVAAFLCKEGYQRGWPMEKMLDYLKERIETAKEFPMKSVFF